MRYRINYTAKMGGSTFTPSVTINQRFPPTQMRQNDAAQASFAPYAKNFRNVSRIRVTSVTKV